MADNEDDKTQVGSTEGEYPCLEIIRGPRAGSHYPLHEGQNFVGRLSENDVVLDDSSVSRRHFSVHLQGETATVSDQGSRNGTQVGGQKIGADSSVPLAHEGRIQVGAYELRFLTKSAGPVAEEPAKELPETHPEEPPEEPPEEIPEEPLPAPRRRRSLVRPLLFVGALLVVIGLGFQVYRMLLPDKGSKKEEVGGLSEEPGEVGGVLSTEQEKGDGDKGAAPIVRPFFLDVSSTPISAHVFFGTQEIGQTPFRVSTDLEDGKWYEARAVFQLLEVKETLEEKVQFQAKSGEDVIPIQFEAKVGVFKVATLPRNSQLYLEGYFESDRFRARPIKFDEIVFGKPVYLPFGRYVLELRESRQLEGSQTFLDKVIYRREFFLNANQTNYAVDVQEKDVVTFPVKISSVPDGAAVLVDNQEVGKTPYEGTFPIGEHTLLLKREGYFEHSQQIKMDMNTLFTAEIKLKTSEAGDLINQASELMKNNRHDEALPILVEALEKNPSERERAEISYLIGVAYLQKKSLKEAEGYFKKAEAHPDFKHHGRLGLSNLAYTQGQNQKALQLLIEVLVNAEDKRVRADAGVLFQALSPLKSVIYVTSDPVGGDVLVNGKPMSHQTPLILHDLGIGSYRIEVKKQGFNPEQVKLNLGVSEFRPVVIKLNPLE